MTVAETFYRRFYDDNDRRIFILGINPGRFGSGVTGIAFTDPIRLHEVLNIGHPFALKQELSSVFVFELIRHFGGLEKFYSAFYINSVCPLGFTRAGRNLNYYDDPLLCESLKPFLVKMIRSQIEFGLSRKTAFCLGEGKNFKFLSTLNHEEGFFRTIIPLPHPRYIMQYKRRHLQEYLNLITRKLLDAVNELT